jgi:uncharacterized protein
MIEKTKTHAYGPVDVSQSLYVQLQTLPLGAVHFKPGFWANRQAINHTVSLRHGYLMLEKAGNFQNLRIAAGLAQGSFSGRNFYDEDIWKWLEALGWELAKGQDEELYRMADEIIRLTESAQCPDGYLNSYVQVVQSEVRWNDLDHGHELYCAGHLFQAGVAFFPRNRRPPPARCFMSFCRSHLFRLRSG